MQKNPQKKRLVDSKVGDKSDVHGFDVAQIDNSVKPSDDFYDYAVGKWIKNNKIPAEYSAWGTFYILKKRTDGQLKNIIKSLIADKDIKDGSIKQKVRDFYISGIDQNEVNKLGYSPISAELKLIDSIANKDNIAKEIARLQKSYCSPFFQLGAEQDLENSDMMILGLWQGGLGLMYKEYYFSKKKHAKELRENYRKFIAEEFKLIGYGESEASKAVESVMKIETELAEASRKPEDLRDPYKNYNPTTLSKLEKKTPDLKWKHFLYGIGIEKVRKITVGQPEFIDKVNEIIKTFPVSDIKTYLKWNLIRSASPYLSTPFVNASFDFYGRKLTGVEKIQPRWKRVLNVENDVLGEAVGQLYVEKYFPPENKKKALEIVHNLLKSMKQRIEQLDWMTADTKAKALDKLSSFKAKIGYPDKWIDYSSLSIEPASYAKNYFSAYKFNFLRDIRKVGKPTDRSEWHMSPQTINAYYTPNNNEIVFPAAILQPPFFNMKADDAINYGSMGVVIGHEITHGFDDQGAKYDKHGNLKKWWTEKDKKLFEARTEKLITQFDKYEPIKGYNVNGKLTLGENIADLGGVTVAYNAFKMTKEYKGGKKIDGFTPTQRFFLGLAQIWRQKTRKQMQILRLKDVHSPAKYRVIGPLSNFTPFYQAFDVQPGSEMFKPENERIIIW